MALSIGEPTQAGGHKPGLSQTMTILRESQWNESRGCVNSHRYFGGTGKDGRSAPDLLHTAQSLQVLLSAGLPADDPYAQKAITFVARCQKVSQSSSPDASTKHDDPEEGGFLVEPALKEASGRGEVATKTKPNGVATCMGLTSLLGSGVAVEDVRIQRALGWLRRHYSLDVHPGMSTTNQGLYRYYYEFARLMRMLGLDHFRDDQGVLHDWREELALRLSDRQQGDGSWVNPQESPEQAHSSPVMITTYALLTLNQIRDSRK
ncbi:hypothetical protein [Singulisphaera sp. PoT]|uniref:hypothetical protein n=1 Tax=Singulisphaera sp. PoT TaxID=3411797 RepID=UPI003BF5326D